MELCTEMCEVLLEDRFGFVGFGRTGFGVVMGFDCIAGHVICHNIISSFNIFGSERELL